VVLAWAVPGATRAGTCDSADWDSWGYEAELERAEQKVHPMYRVGPSMPATVTFEVWRKLSLPPFRPATYAWRALTDGDFHPPRSAPR
jgi:hypothetical protein